LNENKKHSIQFSQDRSAAEIAYSNMVCVVGSVSTDSFDLTLMCVSREWAGELFGQQLEQTFD
jgi:hypothetical protein